MQRTFELLTAIIVGLAMTWLLGCSDDTSPPAGAAREDAGPVEFVGRAVCAECHADQLETWQGSHHDLAMQEATEEHMLADFDDASFEHAGLDAEGRERQIVSTFSRREDGFYVRTDGPDGELRDYKVAYTFGVEPLQQYLVEAWKPGALQTLSLSWDSRPQAEGGQRWFHIYGDEPISHEDPLHWTGPYQNWNYMCAGCHSTGLVRGYDAEADRFETTWKEIDVSCEACHGPGSKHVDAARAGATDGSGLVVDLRRAGRWTFADGATTAHLADAPVSGVQTDACGRCHSRRAPVAPYEHGGDLHDAFSVSLLQDPLYYDDGQIRDEVYVYGSFLQSKMHAAGVTCSDCHEPHSTRLRLPGNAMCTLCHLPSEYDVAEHHHHPAGGEGTACVDCHMPETTYMVVDPRRDHSFRVPRPDLSVRLGTPNACAGCHDDRDDAWAAETVAAWGAEPSFHYGEALHAGRTWQADAEALLVRAISEAAQPAIVRASALASIGPYLSPASISAVEQALQDANPLVRGGALSALEGTEASVQKRLAGPLLQDPVRTVRLRAAQLLAWAAADRAGAGDGLVDPVALRGALDEYRTSLLWRADRPDTHLRLGDLEVLFGRADAAEQAYRRSLEIAPSLSAAAINLADVYRATGRDEDGEALLRRSLERSPDAAGLHQALGLTLIRLGRTDEALVALQKANELDPEVPRYAYVYGVALNDLDQQAEGMRVLAEAAQRFPGDRELVQGYRALAGR